MTGQRSVCGRRRARDRASARDASADVVLRTGHRTGPRLSALISRSCPGPSDAPAGGLGSNAVVADATQTLLCTYLSVVLWAGLTSTPPSAGPKPTPIAGLVIAAVALGEGLKACTAKGCVSGHGSQLAI